FATIVRSDEAEAFGVVEPLNSASCHFEPILQSCLIRPGSRPMHRCQGKLYQHCELKVRAPTATRRPRCPRRRSRLARCTSRFLRTWPFSVNDFLPREDSATQQKSATYAQPRRNFPSRGKHLNSAAVPHPR